MSDFVSYSLNNKIATIEITHGKVNTLSSAVFSQLNAALDQAEADGAVVMIKGQPQIFSAGYDLKELMQGTEAMTHLVSTGSEFTRRLLDFPTPVISVCTGNCIAKGAFILLASDYRIGAAGDYKICLNEVAANLVLHHTGIALAKERLTPSAFNQAILHSHIFSPEAAVTAGFLDKVVPEEELHAAAAAEAERLSTLGMAAHRIAKTKARQEFLAKLDRCIAQDRADLAAGLFNIQK